MPKKNTTKSIPRPSPTPYVAAAPQAVALRIRRNPLDVFLTVLVAVLAVMLAFVLFTKYFWLRSFYVMGESMMPTYAPDEEIYVDCLKKIKRGDVVVLDAPDQRLLKRVVAVAGDTVEARPGDDGLYYIYITYASGGEAVAETYEGVTLPGIRPERLGVLASGPYFINEGYFVMGDNRNNSDDSRSRGTFVKREIIGVVIFPGKLASLLGAKQKSAIVPAPG